MELEEFDIEFLAQKMAENPGSMLFARLADLYLGKEQNAEAMKLLEEGIPNFPTYYAGYIVLGKAHLAFQEYSRASAAFSKALELSPFNQTAAELLAAVPNKPDESTRTTDTNYFTLPGTAPAPAPAPVAASIPEPAYAPETPAAEPSAAAEEEFVLPSFEEMGFPGLESVEAELSAPSQPAASFVEPQQEFFRQPEENFPTYDEYFAQNQQRINIDAPIRLDDYLSGDAVVTAPVAPPVIPVQDVEPLMQHEFVNDAYVEPEPAVPAASTAPAEEHFEPEPVFSSPEQAQLFAEMTGTAVPEPDQTYNTTDLDSLTEKLQSAERIVPQENYVPSTPVPQETPDDQAYESDAVTPTLAEIYASQGEYRAAIQAYEILMFSQPAKGAEYQKRVRELTKLQMEKDGLL
ncbi:MAG: hypothetical protein HUU02_02990 [Bacteroidetes bacterium]|nr:hypothetical protein [Bacteroidota bacterium]